MFGIQRIRTTPYHPSSNGMVERFHSSLKQALRCHNTKWTESLPVVLLGLRNCFKEDLNASCVEMVYGQTVVLPGEFFEPPSDAPSDPTTYLSKLRETFRTLKPTPASCHSKSSCFVHPALETCSHVFVRIDTLKPALSSPYDGPFEVLHRTEKHFTIQKNGKEATISIDRLKPAFLLNIDSTDPVLEERVPTPAVSTPQVQCEQGDSLPVTTRSGRKVQFNPRYL
nr:uncharacterized protein LOC107450149 [Parasteatoda tepidariorum]